MTAVIWCESVLTSVAVRTLEIAAARRCLKCGLRCKQPRFTSVSVLLKDSRVLSTVWPHCKAFPSHSGGQLWYKCLSWSSDAEKKVTARTKWPRHNMVFAQRVQYPAALITDRSSPTSNVYSLFCVYKGHYTVCTHTNHSSSSPGERSSTCLCETLSARRARRDGAWFRQHKRSCAGTIACPRCWCWQGSFSRIFTKAIKNSKI